MPTQNNRKIQTKLKPTNNTDDGWKTIGRAKRCEQESSIDKRKAETNKKTDTKSTPPREVEQVITHKQELPQASLLLAAPPSDIGGSETESNLIAAITNFINSTPISKLSSTVSTHKDPVNFPPLPPRIKLLTDNSGNPNENKSSPDTAAPTDQTFSQIKVSDESQAMDTDDNPNKSLCIFLS
jgi:hypothetical protein